MKQLLDVFLKQTGEIHEKTQAVPEAAFDFRPFDEAWTIKEHLIHLADNEVNVFLRFKTALAEPENPVFVIDEEKWVKSIDVEKLTLSEYLNLFGLLRKLAYEVLAEIPEEQWEHLFLTHPSVGKFGLKLFLQKITDHVKVHMDYIDRNLKMLNEINGLAGKSHI